MGAYLMYQIIIKKPAKKFIDKLPLHEKRRLLFAIEQLLTVGDIKKMQGIQNYYRLRVGDYRIVYTVDHGELVICIVAAGNRGDIYK